jgi:hypothetical protein
MPLVSHKNNKNKKKYPIRPIPVIGGEGGPVEPLHFSHNYGIDRVAQLFGVNDLNGRIDLNMNGSEAEGGVFTEDLVTWYPLLVTKCNTLRGTIAGEGLPLDPALQGPFLKMCLNG